MKTPEPPQEDRNPRERVVDGAREPNKPELGKVGKVIVTVVALAILVPFIAILWAWAQGVIRGMGMGW